MNTGTADRARDSVGRRRNARGEGKRLREEILEAAEALLGESHDAGRLSLRGVAKKVGIAATSVYLQFPDVDHLKVALAERGFVELNKARETAAQGIADPVLAVLARSRAYARFALRYPGRYRLMFGPDLPPTLAYGAERSPSRQTFQTLVNSVERCQQAGLALPEPDAARLATEVWVSVHGLVMLRMDRPHFPWAPLDEMVDEMVGRLLGFNTAGSGHGVRNGDSTRRNVK